MYISTSHGLWSFWWARYFFKNCVQKENCVVHPVPRVAVASSFFTHRSDRLQSPFFAFSRVLPACNPAFSHSALCWSALPPGSAPCHQPWLLLAVTWHSWTAATGPLLQQPQALAAAACSASSAAISACSCCHSCAWSITASPCQSWALLRQVLLPLNWLEVLFAAFSLSAI